MNKFCGIDLHSNNSAVVVSDEANRVAYQLADADVEPSAIDIAKSRD